jgi:hypothetical protein
MGEEVYYSRGGAWVTIDYRQEEGARQASAFIN